MTTDTEVRPLTAHEATRSLPSLRGYTDIAGHVAAIADGRHAVYDTATHEAVERSELERLRQQLAELLGALTSDTLNKMMGMIEDVGDDEMWGLAQIWMEQRDAAIRNAQQEQNQ